jgi:hypothetical protein
MQALLRTRATAVAALLGAALALGCNDNGGDVAGPGSGAILRKVTRTSGDLVTSVPAFAAAIGAVDNAGAPGQHDAGGRRRVNWDGVPAQFTDVDNFPATFFNLTATRGLEYLTATGTGLRVSDNGFTDINPTYATELIPFTNPKLFAPIGTNRAEFQFRIPGSATPAVIQSFGAVVVDVDRPNSTRLQAFDKDGRLIANVEVPTHRAPDASSLVGVQFDRPAIARIVITLGTAALAAGTDDISRGGSKDVVALDDFLYSEPQPVQ